MRTLQQFPIFLLALAIVFLKINYSLSEPWHEGFKPYEVTDDMRYTFTGDYEQFAKLSPLESMLLSVKKWISPTGQRAIPGDMQRSLTRFYSVLQELSDKNTTQEAYGRCITEIRDILATLLRMMMTKVSTGMSQAAETLGEEIETAYEYAQETATTMADIFKRYTKGFTFPGTLWCGAGNIAFNNDELGDFHKADACCRDHDHCPFSMEAMKGFGSLKNTGVFTKSACYCDYEFYQCLTNANNMIATKLGITYFTLLSPQCIGKMKPVESGCNEERQGWLRKCISPKTSNGTERMQWLDVPDFGM